MKVLKKIYLGLTFIVFFILKVIQANIYIAYDILTPKIYANPGFIWIPIKVNSDFGILLLNNLITMTPGTLSVEISEDKSKILVHCLYYNMKEKIVSDIENMQTKIINLTS